MSLFYPFERSEIAMPQKNEQWLASGLETIPDPLWKDYLTIIQPWRRSYRSLQAAKFSCKPVFDDEQSFFDGGLLELSKHRGLNQNRFLDLLKRVKPHGCLVIHGSKTVGGASMLKWVNQFIPIEEKWSKNHGVIFTIRRPVADHEIFQPSLRVLSKKVEHGFHTQAGMFSHGKVDRGSALLVPYLDRIVFGKTADFGAGWGYLGYQALKLAPKLISLDLFEADYHALEAAKQHLAPYQPHKPIQFYWHDIPRESIEGIYDTIISNPPFHEGKMSDISLGQSFIETASKRLKNGGCLLMVANRQLPYEKTLQIHFRKVFVLQEQDGFKIIEARK
ncbi:class I SAM-dependent methyltransferase [Bartonella tamiae]|uniref:Methyltransferase small domain-containing protein n=1 Tax=Bartonella tamiae Th239 TaxID=1094558 RepID=J1K1D6_9HYPH|nr:class I SAM-dependent methyltransferase [Bartonella tamiae]EJF91267.1 hypothetical protein ME5_00599 [Bartonella tamiae Th239]EJF93068.1 hypothetical protein MEG_01282 [Bartonella tamiae Th307]